MSWCAFSVDLDSVEDYARGYRVHNDPVLADEVYTQSAAELESFLAAARVPATMFVVTRDIVRPARAAALKSLQRSGFELGLHSHSHQPALDAARLADEFDQSVAALQALTGAAPRGYRAPSYVVHDFVYERMIRHGLAFSSSVLRTPLIAVFKLLFNLKTLGRNLPGRERWLAWGRLPAIFSPNRPYAPRPGQFWRADAVAKFIEIPLTSVPWYGVPFQFTYLAPFRDRRVAEWGRLLDGQPINTSFHLLDFVDEALSRRLGSFNPNLRLPLAERLRKARLLVDLALSGRTPTTLYEVADSERRRINDSRP